MSKKEFWTRFAFWVVFAFAIPIAIITYEYDLVKPGQAYKFTGWGLIVSIILFLLVYVVLGYVLKTMKWSKGKQFFDGVRVVILPLAFLFLIATIIATNIDKIKIVLVVMMVTELIAIPINPFPQWVWEKNMRDIKEAIK